MDTTAAQADQPNPGNPAAHTVPIGDYGFLSDGVTTALVAPGA